MCVGARILIDDGELSFLVDDVRGSEYMLWQRMAELLALARVGEYPRGQDCSAFLTERDRRNIGYAIDLDVDFIAHSFVRSARRMLDIQAHTLMPANSHIKIISKIENQEGHKT